MSRSTKDTTKKHRQDTIQNLFSLVSDLYMNKDHRFEKAVKMLLDASFEWDKCYKVKPTESFDANVEGNADAEVKWRLYAKCGANSEKKYAKFS